MAVPCGREGCHAQHRHVLAATSLLFVLPALALPPCELKALVTLLVVTSLAYHTLHWPALRVLDKVAVRLVVLWAVLMHPSMTPLGYYCILGVFTLYYLPCFHARDGAPYLQLSCHGAMHALGALGLAAIA